MKRLVALVLGCLVVGGVAFTVVKWRQPAATTGDGGATADSAATTAPVKPARRTREPLVQRVAWGTLIKIDGKTLVIRPPASSSDLSDVPSGDVPSTQPLFTITVDDQTKYLGQAKSLAQLEPDAMRLDVMAFAARDAEPARLEITSRHANFEGEIVRVEGSKLTVKATGSGPEAGREVVVTMGPSTELFSMAAMFGGSPRSELVAGKRVSIQGAPESPKQVAIVPENMPGQAMPGGIPNMPGRPRMVAGKILRVEGNRLVVTGRAGQPEETVEVEDPQTPVVIDYELATLADLKPEMSTTVSWSGRPPKMRIQGRAETVLAGQLESIEGTDLAVRVQRPDRRYETVLVETDAQTRLLHLPRPAPGIPPTAVGGKTFDDIQSEVHVMIYPAEGVAKKVVVLSDLNQKQ